MGHWILSRVIRTFYDTMYELSLFVAYELVKMQSRHRTLNTRYILIVITIILSAIISCLYRAKVDCPRRRYQSGSLRTSFFKQDSLMEYKGRKIHRKVPT